MIVPRVDLELPQLLGSEAVVGQHALDGPADDLLRPAGEEVTQGLLLEAAGIPAVALVQLRLELVPGHGDPGGVQDDDVVAAVHVGRIGGLVLALEDVRDPRREAAERLVRRVDDVPASLDLALPRRIGLRVRAHSSSSLSSTGRRPRTTRRRQSPLAGAAAPFRAGPCPASAARRTVSSIVPWPTCRRPATIRRTCPRRKALALTSIVTRPAASRTRTAYTVRTEDRSVTPAKPEKSCRPSKTDPALAIAAMSSGDRTPSA